MTAEKKNGKEENLVARLLSSGLTAPPALAGYIETVGGPTMKVLGAIINIVVRQHDPRVLSPSDQASSLHVQGPFYMKLGQLSFSAYKSLPVDLLSALTGLGLCFCGGSYCASIAAVEACNAPATFASPTHLLVLPHSHTPCH